MKGFHIISIQLNEWKNGLKNYKWMKWLHGRDPWIEHRMRAKEYSGGEEDVRGSVPHGINKRLGINKMIITFKWLKPIFLYLILFSEKNCFFVFK